MIFLNKNYGAIFVDRANKRLVLKRSGKGGPLTENSVITVATNDGNKKMKLGEFILFVDKANDDVIILLHKSYLAEGVVNQDGDIADPDLIRKYKAKVVNIFNGKSTDEDVFLDTGDDFWGDDKEGYSTKKPNGIKDLDVDISVIAHTLQNIKNKNRSKLDKIKKMLIDSIKVIGEINED